jgi:hypothetical protein
LLRDYFKQFTLTWGEQPADLDAHLWTPVIDTASYHVFYAFMGSQYSAPFAHLDVDDMESYGPEHITIFDNFPGSYVFAVHHYSGDSTITVSEAQVSVVDSAGNGVTLYPPDEPSFDDYWWHVCSVDGQTGDITPINIVSPDPPISFLNEPPMPPKEYLNNE